MSAEGKKVSCRKCELNDNCPGFAMCPKLKKTTATELTRTRKALLELYEYVGINLAGTVDQSKELGRLLRQAKKALPRMKK